MQIMRPKFDEAEIEQIRQCLDSGWVTQGPKVAAFEQQFADLHKVEFARATTSCTAALHLATLALGLGPGDEVVVPAFTWITSANAAEYVGADVVFADIDPETFNISAEAFAACLTPRTKAVVVVHLFGLAADMDPILEIARKHDIHVIEDAACAISTSYKGVPVGGLGTIGCFSFHPRKVITTGEGGMVSTNDPAIAEKVSALRSHGASISSAQAGGEAQPWQMNEFNILGFNLRLSDIQAAVGLAQLRKLDELIDERRAAAAHYDELLGDISEVRIPTLTNAQGHTFQSYVIRIVSNNGELRNSLMAELARRDIQTRPGTHAVHRLGYYREKYGLRPDDFPNAAIAEDQTITLPIFPGMTEGDRNLVVDAIKDQLAGKAARP